MTKHVLITAGPTREPMDPVRFLSNPSSGAMGIALAETLARRGVHVTLVLGPTHLRPSKKIKTIPVVTALDMAAAVRNNILKADAFIATAAVGDWRFARIAGSKLKKGARKTMTVKLVRNPDILAEVGRAKKMPLVGFALEMNNEKKNALKKLREKSLDLVIANRPDSFSSDKIKPTWIERSGKITRWPIMAKKSLAQKIAQWLERRWNEPK